MATAPVPDDAPATQRHRQPGTVTIVRASPLVWVWSRDAGQTAPLPRTRRADLAAIAAKTAIERIALSLARSSAVFVDAQAWFRFGYARVEDHARERFQRTSRWVRDQASLGRAVARIPALADALLGQDGGRPVGRVAATWIGKVATPESVGAWVSLARQGSVRRLKTLVRDAARDGSNWPPASGGATPSADSESDPAHPAGISEAAAIRSNASVTQAAGGAPSAANGAVPAPDAGRFPQGESPTSPVGLAGAAMRAHDAGRFPRGELTTSPVGLAGAAVAAQDAGRFPRGESRVGREASDDEQARQQAVDERSPRQLVRLAAPATVRAALDEALVLYRGIAGHESTLTAFVDALTAEGQTLVDPPDLERSSLRASSSAEEAESRLDAAGNAAGLPDEPTPDAIPARVVEALAALDRIERAPDDAGPVEAERRLRQLIRLEDDLERLLGELLRELAMRGAWATFLFRGIPHYIEQRLGLDRSRMKLRARLHRSLVRFPRLREAYENGRIGVEAALLVQRILGRGHHDDDLERAWVEHAAEVTVKRLRDEARALGRRRAESGGSPPGPLSDAEWHASLLQRPGTIRDRVHRLGDIAARDPWSADVVFLGLRLPEDIAGAFAATLESTRVALTRLVEQVPWDQPWPDEDAPASIRIAREYFVRCRRLPTWVALLALLEEFVDTWDDPRGMPARRSDEVYARDGWRCAAPGCTSRSNLEDHHVRYRSQGGGNELANRVCVCRFHHQQGEHGGLAQVRGSLPLDSIWRLGRRDLASWFQNERRLGRYGVGACFTQRSR